MRVCKMVAETKRLKVHSDPRLSDLTPDVCAARLRFGLSIPLGMLAVISSIITKVQCPVAVMFHCGIEADLIPLALFISLHLR